MRSGLDDDPSRHVMEVGASLLESVVVFFGGSAWYVRWFLRPVCGLLLSANGSGDDFEWAHHVVGFVFEDVAVVEVFAGVAFEADDDARYCTGRALNGVFPAKFIGFRRLCRCNKTHLFRGHVLEGVEGAAVEELEAHEVDVHGVRVFCLVDELPDFGGVEFWKLGGGFVPVLVVDEHDHGVL